MHLVTSWDEWCQVFNRIGFWEAEVRRVCEMHQIDVLHLAETFPGTHAVFFINDDMVLKFFCPVQYNTCQEEKTIHQTILKGNRLYPRVLFSGKSPTGYDYLVFERSPGSSVRELGMDSLNSGNLAQLAWAVVDLHRRTLVRSSTNTHCLVHYDLTRDHIFLDERRSLSAIIDFGDAFIGQPADEFPALFVDGLDCNDRFIQEFTRYYNELSDFYQYEEWDLITALIRHPFYEDILEILKKSDSPFSKMVLKSLEKFPLRP